MGTTSRSASSEGADEVVHKPVDSPFGRCDEHPDSSHAAPAPTWSQLAAEQHGVIARRQLLGLGLTGSQARRHLANGQWHTIFPGVYLTHAGPAFELGNVWAALLYAGAGAALSHGTALRLDGVLDASPGCSHLTIAQARRVKPQPGLRVHRSAWTSDSVHPGRSPTRTRIEHSVLDHLMTADEDCVIDVLTRATQRRLTTASRLAETLAGRPRHPHRSLINDVLADVEQGVQSPLERRFLRDVEQRTVFPADFAIEAKPRQPAPSITTCATAGGPLSSSSTVAWLIRSNRHFATCAGTTW